MFHRVNLVSLVSMNLTLLAVAAGCAGRLSDGATTSGPDPTDLAPDGQSVVHLDDGSIALLPASRIAAERLDECSGVVHHRGAFFAHNDSGDEPVLYRATSLDFSDVEVLEVQGAVARDWEDIGLLGDDILVFDIGDNRRERDDLVIYRVRYRMATDAEPGRLDTIASYPIAYPNGRHDAEAGFSVDGAVYVVSKARGERETYVYRFDELHDVAELAPGARNVPVLLGTLDIGEGETVTAGTFDAASREVFLLTYSTILIYPVDALHGAPASTTRLWARQCESLCLCDGQVLITNEERDVFLVDERDARGGVALIPPRGRLVLPRDTAAPIALRASSPEDALSWVRDGDLLRIRFAVAIDDSVSSTSIDPVRPGGLVVFMFGNDDDVRVGAQHRFVVVGRRVVGRSADREFGVWRFDGAGGMDALAEYDAATLSTQVTDRAGRAVLEGELAFPLTDVLRDTDTFLFDARTLGLRNDGGPYVSGLGAFSMYRPYTWAVVTSVPVMPAREPS